MNCIIVDDEPLAREGVKLLVDTAPQLDYSGSFGNAQSASQFMDTNPVDLIFLDIKMPGVSGIEFARTIPHRTLIIFTTAYAEYAIDSYEVEAVDYLIKPIGEERFRAAINKAEAYHSLLDNSDMNSTGRVENEYIFVKSDRRFIKIEFADIAFVEALKDYVIIQTAERRVITDRKSTRLNSSH